MARTEGRGCCCVSVARVVAVAAFMCRRVYANVCVLSHFCRVLYIHL